MVMKRLQKLVIASKRSADEDSGTIPCLSSYTAFQVKQATARLTTALELDVMEGRLVLIDVVCVGSSSKSEVLHRLL